MCGALYLLAGGGEEGIRQPIRATARTSLVLFVLVFCASALRRWIKSDQTAWLLRNRRYLGLSVAVSHGYHLAFILAFYWHGGLGEPGIVTVVGGGWGFVLLFLMAATSNDASQRRLRAKWRRLHLLGMYTVWVIFVVSYLPRVPELIPALASAALLGSLALRLWPAARQSERLAST